MYWRALGELVNGPLNIANSGPLIEAKYNAFAANGLSVENPTANIEPWLSQAQTSIASQLAAVNAINFSVNASVTVSNNMAYVTGTAPVNVDAVWINGAAYPLTWTSLTGWTVAVPLATGTNQIQRHWRGPKWSVHRRRQQQRQRRLCRDQRLAGRADCDQRNHV